MLFLSTTWLAKKCTTNYQGQITPLFPLINVAGLKSFDMIDGGRQFRESKNDIYILNIIELKVVMNKKLFKSKFVIFVV